jgi:hypothetical protein
MPIWAIGLILPEIFKSEPAWGERRLKEIEKLEVLGRKGSGQIQYVLHLISGSR